MIIVKWQEVINGKKKDIHQHVVNMQLANQLRNSKRSEGVNAWIEMVIADVSNSDVLLTARKVKVED